MGSPCGHKCFCPYSTIEEHIDPATWMPLPIFSQSYVTENGYLNRTLLTTACVDKSGHLTLLSGAGDGEVVSKEVGEEEGRARKSGQEERQRHQSYTETRDSPLSSGLSDAPSVNSGRPGSLYSIIRRQINSSSSATSESAGVRVRF
jgi:hypothetical protein